MQSHNNIINLKHERIKKNIRKHVENLKDYIMNALHISHTTCESYSEKHGTRKGKAKFK